MKLGILFVDDDNDILQGLKRSLRNQRKEWQMFFALSGQEALEVLKQQKIHILISDMRMPEMDGSRLLELVAKSHPEVIRMILSGYSDNEYIIRTAGIAHQFMLKPTNVTHLINNIKRIILLRKYVTNNELFTFIHSLKNLPSMPETYNEMMEKIRLSETSIHDIATIINKDPGMSTKILQLVNSAFFGLGNRISNILDAATLIGLDTIRAMTLSVGIFSQFEQNEIKDPNFSIQNLQYKSFLMANLAKQIAMQMKAPKYIVDDCFMSGLVHEIGLLILQYNFSNEYIKIYDLIEQGISRRKAEIEVFGTCHNVIGAYLLGVLGIPEPIVEAVAFHNQPCRSRVKEFCPLVALHIACSITNDGSQQNTTNENCKLDKEFIEQVGLTNTINEWQSQNFSGVLHD